MSRISIFEANHAVTKIELLFYGNKRIYYQTKQTEQNKMKIVILGDSNTGKTTWVYRLLGITTPTKPTMGVEVYNTQYNGQNFELWDTGYGGIREGYFMGAACAFILYTDRAQVDKFKREIIATMGQEIPVVAFNLKELKDAEEPFRNIEM